VSASSPRETSNSSPAYAWWIFLAGLVIFVVFQTGLVLDVQLSRKLPPEAKDAYRYIYNAVQLREGFNYDTPALKDFRTLTNYLPGDSVERRNQKWIDYHSFFFTHYVLHSGILLLVSWMFGVSLGTAYKITCVLGSLLIAGAISYFLLTITDKISAGLALASMAVTIFPMQGIHYVVPTNLCMALGLILLTIVLRTGGKSKWMIFGLSIILIYLHRMGIIYASIGVFTAAFLRYKEVDVKKVILELLPTLILIVISAVIIFIFPLKFFRLAPMTTPLDTNYWREVGLNFLELLKLFGNWFVAHGVVYLPRPIYNLMTSNWISYLGFQILGLSLVVFPWLLKKDNLFKYQKLRWLVCLIGAMILLPIFSALVLIIILRAGLMSPPHDKRSSFYIAFLIFFLILFPSVLQVMYIAEWKHAMTRADLTTRLWIPFAVVLAAIFGRGLYLVFQNLRAKSYDFIPGPVRNHDLIRNAINPRFLSAVLLVFLVIGYAPRLAQAYQGRQTIKSFMLIRQNVVFDPGQVKLTYKSTVPQDIIVYDDDFIRHYFLSHGGLWRRALYLPLLPLPDSYKFSPGDIKYEISWNPYLSLYHHDYERAIEDPLIISAGSNLTLALEPDFKPEAIQILSGSNLKRVGSGKLQIIRENSSGEKSQEDIDIKGDTWQSFPLKPGAGGTLTLVNADPSEPFYLAGLRFGGRQEHNFSWPWHGVTQVSLYDKQLKMKRSALLKNKIKIKDISYSREVVQDKGSTVLWRLKPQREENGLHVPSPAGLTGNAQEPATSLLKPGSS
jgi:hypothetical protein